MQAAWKRAVLLLAVSGLALMSTACSLLPTKDENVQEPSQPTISPIVEASEDYYPSVVPYKPNQTRGMLSAYGYRIDFSHLELGLMEMAQSTFSPEKFLFQEGQLLKKEQVRAWLARQKANPEAINPEKGPLFFIHVLEHDYLDKETQQVAGMVLGISLSSLYLDANGVEKEYTRDELRAKGQQLVSQLLPKIRVDHPTVPMVIALYQVPPKNSTMVPGRFIMSGTVNASEGAVAKWVPIDESFYLFPSDAADKEQAQTALQYDKLRKNIQGFFGEYIGIAGLGRFMGGELQELTITATAEYDSRTEVLQFTQYTAGLIDELFDKNVHINLYVQSVNQPLAVYIRPIEGKPYLHVYRK